MQQNIIALSLGSRIRSKLLLLSLCRARFCLTNTHPKEKVYNVLWASQSPLMWVSQAPGLAHSTREPNQPPPGTKSQYFSTPVRWPANETKSIYCFPSVTKAKSSCISAYEMVASFTITFHHSARRGRDTELGKQSWSLGRGEQVGILGATGARALGFPAGSAVLWPPSIRCVLMALRCPHAPHHRKAASS